MNKASVSLRNHNMVSGLADIIKAYNRESDIGKWITNVENAIAAVIGENVSDNRKIAMLMTFIGDEGKTVIENMTQDQKDTYPHLKEALKQHYADAINITVEDIDSTCSDRMKENR